MNGNGTENEKKKNVWLCSIRLHQLKTRKNERIQNLYCEKMK